MAGCEVELEGQEAYELQGCFVALGLLVVLFKWCACSRRATKQLYADCLKQVAGAGCLYGMKLACAEHLIDVGVDGSSCAWAGAEAIADATLGVLVVFVFFGLVKNLLLCCRLERCAGLLTPGACVSDGRCMPCTFLVQLVVWPVAVGGAKVATLLAMVAASEQASKLAEEELMPHVQGVLKPLLDSPRLQHLSAAVVVPAAATALQFLLCDCVFVHFARRAKRDLEQPLLQDAPAQAATADAPVGTKPETQDDWGPTPQRIHFPQDQAPAPDPEDLGGAKICCAPGGRAKVAEHLKKKWIAISQPGKDRV